MKKGLLTVITLALVLSFVLAFAGCIDEVDGIVSTGFDAKAPLEDIVGYDIEAVDDSMSGTDMMMTALANYDKTWYSAVLLTGKVDTTVLGGLTVIQAVEGLRIREAVDEDPTMTNVFMFNNSYQAGGNLGTNIKVMENYFVNPDREVKLLSAGSPKKIDIVDKVLTAKEWAIDEPYDNMEDYLIDNPNDPTKLNMYDLKGNITSTTKPTYVKGEDMGYYTFDVECDAVKAFKDYKKVMKYMLDQNVSGAKIKDEGMVLTFKVQIWENGLFKSYDVVEKYGIAVASIVNGVITLEERVSFNYDNEVEPISKYYDMVKGDFVAKTTMVTPPLTKLDENGNILPETPETPAA